MPSMVDIKSRMKSIKGTQQMTKAMNLVASAKLGRARQRLSSSRPFNKESHRIISDIVRYDTSHPFFATKKDGNTIYIVITSDRGLCGGYNSNAMKEVERTVHDNTQDWQSVQLYTIGKRCTDTFTKRGRNILAYDLGISEKPAYLDAKKVANKVISEYRAGNATKVVLVYTHFESIITHNPTVKTLLPINPNDFKVEGQKYKDVTIHEPIKEELLDFLLPGYITTQIYDALAESSACEQGARMTSMDNATKNAKEALAGMTLIYNRARQAAITQEISEIVGGANAIQGG
ncbi:MAG: ATP synthase F1 subunit gamma [Defluviitaleaceae bacterium]|nr:ATP synthase F1 subunit gamma [Defluviitaleaceae bacterium]